MKTHCYPTKPAPGHRSSCCCGWHSYLCSCAENQIRELIQVEMKKKTTNNTPTHPHIFARWILQSHWAQRQKSMPGKEKKNRTGNLGKEGTTTYFSTLKDTWRYKISITLTTNTSHLPHKLTHHTFTEQTSEQAKLTWTFHTNFQNTYIPQQICNLVLTQVLLASAHAKDHSGDPHKCLSTLNTRKNYLLRMKAEVDKNLWKTVFLEAAAVCPFASLPTHQPNICF